MVKINPLGLMAILEFLLLFIVISIVFYIQYRKKCRTVIAAQEEITGLNSTIDDLQLEIRNLRTELKDHEDNKGDQQVESSDDTEKDSVTEQKTESQETSADKDVVDELRKKFGNIRESNNKVMVAVTELIKESGKENEYSELLSALEQNSKELEMCIEVLKHENLQLERQKDKAEKKLNGLNEDMKNLVTKAEYDREVAEKNRLEIRVKKAEEEIKDKDEEIQKLEKNYSWLEKEYNALYDNIIGEQSP